MRILHVISSLNPAFGGPAAWLVALTPELEVLGHESEVVCGDVPTDGFVAEFPGRVHAIGPSRGGYAYIPRLVRWLRGAAAGYDAVVAHGLWQYHTSAVRRALGDSGRPPYFVFPHGMLDPWFQRQYPRKHLKKLIYWNLFERRALRDATAVLFTCEQERRLAQGSFPGYRARERVVAFGTIGAGGTPAAQLAAFRAQYPEIAARPLWLFLGRIHLKKGVDLLLEAYAALAREHPTLPALVVAGPASDEAYLRDLKARAAASGVDAKVYWPGMLTGDVKWGALRAAEAFILPSHQENFGIAVAEALSCGTPVLISDQVNIWREIADDGAGLVAPDTAEGTRELLERWRSLAADARVAMQAAAVASFAKRFEIQAAARNFVRNLEESGARATAKA